jgi:hypothetical protein
MTNNVLYYPYIRVPNNDWFTRVLLYWDTVGSIVPYEYVMNPETLGPHMGSLLTEGLVKHVVPADYLHRVPNFTEAFVQRAEQFRAQHNLKPGSLANLPTFRIHIEKLEYIGNILCEMGLARKSKYPWYEIEGRLADIFMAYLAGVLSNLPEVESHPITDTSDQLSLYESPEMIRTLVLDELLPAPSGGVPASDLSRFKSKNKKLLINFRSQIESFIILAGSIPELAARKELVGRFLGHAKAEIDNIVDAMKSHGWTKISNGRFFTYTATGAALADAIATGGLLTTIAAAFGTAASAYTTYRETRLPDAFQNSFVAYAALAKNL